MRIGFDLDGVMADFNASFIELVKAVTKRNLFPEGYQPHTWNYPEALGYTNAEVSEVWDYIESSGDFWRTLQPYAGAAAAYRRWLLAGPPLGGSFHEIYFITSRMGRNVKFQTEEWCEEHLYDVATVLISSKKGAIARALELDFYIDDRVANFLDVQETSPDTCVYLLDQPWNQHLITAHRIRRVDDFLQTVDHYTESLTTA